MKIYIQNLTKKLLLTAAVATTATVGFAQVSIADNDPKVTNFNNWNGTLPGGWVMSGASAATTYRGTSATTTGGVYAIANSGFDYLPSSSATPLSLQGTFKNNTGAAITSLRISYVAFKVSTNTRTPGWAVTSTLGGVSTLNWAYNAASTAAAPDSSGIVLTGLNIAANATFTLTFASDRGGGSGSSPMIGLNRVTITNLTPSSPLFIQLSEFSAVNRGSTNELMWKTAREDAGDIFEVERSGNGKKFSKIGMVSANGAAPSVYQFTDDRPVSGINFYRLRFINNDGTVFYSNVASANIDENKTSAIAIYPNPMTDKLNVAVTGEISDNAKIMLFDGLGRICYQQNVPQSGIITVNTSQFVPGIYFVKYFDGKEQTMVKIIK